MKHSHKHSAYHFCAQKNLSFYCLTQPICNDPVFLLVNKIDLLCKTDDTNYST